MRYEVIRYPGHYEVIDHLTKRTVYETRRPDLAQFECNRLNYREDTANRTLGRTSDT